MFIKLKGLALGLFSREELARDANLPEASPAGFSGIALAHNPFAPLDEAGHMILPD